MHLCDRINSGMLFYEHGHTDPIDIQQEKQLQEEWDHCKEALHYRASGLSFVPGDGCH